MKWICWLFFIVFYISTALASTEESLVQRGDSRETVLQTLGQPTGVMHRDDKEVLLFDVGFVTLRNDVVIEVEITAARIERARKLREEEAFAVAQRGKGLVLFEGEWLTAERREAIKARRKLLLKERWPEDKIVLGVRCRYGQKEHWPDYLIWAGRPANGEYHYDVYIPRGYHSDENRAWPCIFIASPSGRARLGALASRVRSEGWFAIMLTESSNDMEWSEMAGNFVAAYDDVCKRFRIDRRYRFATGFSGGARATTLFATLRDLSGLILQGAGFWWTPEDGQQFTALKHSPNLRVFALMGNQDRNMCELDLIADHVNHHQIEVYAGRHTWAPEPNVHHAIDWLKKELHMP